MADTAVAITAGTGTNIDTRTEGTNGNHRQVVVLGDPSTNAGVAPVDATLGLSTYFSTQPTISVVGGLAAGGTISVYQGTNEVWKTTLATLPVQAGQSGTWTVQPGNTPNTTGWLVTLATLPVNIGTPSVLNAGGSLSSAQLGTWTVQPGNTPNTVGWLITQATLPVAVGTHAVTQSGTWTVQPGNTPNTTAWLTTQATLPVVVGTHAVTQSGTWTIQPGNTPNTTGWLVTLATLSVIPGAKYLPTLASMPDQGYVTMAVDLFGNLRVNPNVALPNSININKNYSAYASNASLRAAPGSGKRYIIRELDFSADATVSMQIVEDHAGSPAVVWGPHYFPQNGGVTKTNCYIPLTANKSLGITTSGGNTNISLRVETENT